MVNDVIESKMTVLMSAVSHHDAILQELVNTVRHTCDLGGQTCELVEKAVSEAGSAKALAVLGTLLGGGALVLSIRNKIMISEFTKKSENEEGEDFDILD